MAATTAPATQETCSVVFEPEIVLPDGGVGAETPSKLENKTRAMFVGLVSVQMECSFVNVYGERVERQLQKITVVDATAGTVPDIAADAISERLYYRAHLSVSQILLSEEVEPGTKVKFTAVFYRKVTKGKQGDTKQVSFYILALKEDLIDNLEEEFEEGEEGEDEEGEEGEEEEGEEGEDEEGEEGEEGEGEDEDDENVTTAEAHRRRVRRLRALGTPRTGPGVRMTTAGFELPRASFESAEDNPLGNQPPPETVGSLPRAPRGRSRHESPAAHQPPPGPHAPTLLRRTPSHGHPLSAQAESDIVLLMREMNSLQIERERMVMARDAHFFAEMRASMTSMRTEFQYFMGESRAELQATRDQLDRANGRLYELSNLSGNYLENQAKANEQGWQAFQAGMQMMVQSAQNTGSEQQKIHAMQLQQLSYQHQMELERERERNTRALPAQGQTSKQDSERGSFVRQVVAPLASTIAAEVLKARGNEAAAAFVQSAAEAYLGDDDEEGDEDEETGDDGIFKMPTAPKGKGAGPDPESEGPPGHLVKLPRGYTLERLFDEQPIVAMLRCLRAWLTKAQRKDVIELLGKDTWGALETASKQPKDAKAFMKLIAVRETLQEPGLREEIGSILSANQAELLDDLLTKLEERGGVKKSPKTVVDTTATPKEDG